MHLIVLSGVSLSSLQYCLLQVLVLHAGISTPCVIVLQVELQYLLYIHFMEHLTLAASQITMAIIVIGT